MAYVDEVWLFRRAEAGVGLMFINENGLIVGAEELSVTNLYSTQKLKVIDAYDIGDCTIVADGTIEISEDEENWDSEILMDMGGVIETSVYVRPTGESGSGKVRLIKND